MTVEAWGHIMTKLALKPDAIGIRLGVTETGHSDSLREYIELTYAEWEGDVIYPFAPDNMGDVLVYVNEAHLDYVDGIEIDLANVAGANADVARFGSTRVQNSISLVRSS